MGSQETYKSMIPQLASVNCQGSVGGVFPCVIDMYEKIYRIIFEHVDFVVIDSFPQFIGVSTSRFFLGAVTFVLAGI